MDRWRWLLFLPALSACSLITGDADEPSCLEITVPEQVDNLRGIEVRVHWPGEDKAFAASDLPSDCFVVPEVGLGSMDVTLAQDGEIVAEGSASWEFSRNSWWKIDIDRGVDSPQHFEDWPETNPRTCTWFWCHSVWGFPIHPDAANSEGETVWIVIWHYIRDECADICGVDGYTVP